MSKSSMAVKNIAITLVIFGVLFILLGNINLAAAQAPEPAAGEPACAGHGVPSYQEWVKDLPCKPRYLGDGTNSRQTPAGRLDGVPEGSSKPSYYSNWVYLAYQSYQDGNWEIYGAETWFYTGIQENTRMTANLASDINPRVRPGSPQVVFASNRSGAYEIYLMDWGGLNLKKLTSHQSYASQPAWSPDGKKLAFVSAIDGNQEIYVMDADGSNQKRLTNSAKDDFGPYWSPDGSQIVWVQALDQTYGVINIMNADGTNPHPITEKLRYVEHPAWSSDGSKVVFDYDSNHDDWFDIGLMDANGENLTVRLYGENNVDYLAGPWSMFDPDYFLVTHIQYVIYDRQYYVYSSCVAKIHQAFGYHDCMDYSELDFLPDAALVDVYPPETQVEPLPPFMRAGVIPINAFGSDFGVSGLYTTLVHYRLGQQEDWKELGLISQDWPGPLELSSEAGQTVYFRSQGQDWAFNVEPWPETWDTYTQVYAWGLEGSVLDNRGVGIANALVQSQPVFSDQFNTDAHGSFHRYVPTSTVEVEVSKTGYNTVPKRTLTSQTDIQSTWVLPPADNLIEGENLNFSLTSGPYPTNTYTQVVTLTSDLRKPTLSFLYQFTNLDGLGNFEVSVNDQSVFTRTQELLEMTHQWVDLSPWQNQTITLTFKVENVIPQYSMVTINDGTIGSWLTPILDSIAPQEVKAGTPLVLTLTGDNFIDPPTLRLNEKVYTGLEFIDEHTLKLTLNSGLAPGIYDVWIANPGGQEALLPAALQVGERVFLPLLTTGKR
jgi:hypothetical protein